MKKVPPINFSTLIRIIEAKPDKKRAPLKQLLREGGFAFWRPLSSLAGKVVNGQLAGSELEAAVKKLATKLSFASNLASLSSLATWSAKHKPQVLSTVLPVEKEFGVDGPVVRLRPELALMHGGQETLVIFWTNKTMTPSPLTLSIALEFFRQSFAETEYANWRFAVFLATAGRLFTQSDMASNVPVHLAAEKKRVADAWNALLEEQQQSEQHPIQLSAD
jgi:hypothetical protein